MSVDQPNVVDAIGIAQNGEVVLTAFDHREWDEANEHLVLLQDKLNTYLAFVEGGQLLEEYPDATGRPVRIDVVCRCAPSTTAEQFLGAAEAVCANAGLLFSWRTVAV